MGASALGVAVGYIIKKHMDWKPNPDSKKRMLIHQLVFWGSGVPALKFLHKTWSELESSSLHLKPRTSQFRGGSWWAVAGWLSAATGTLIGGFEGGERLARFLVPKKPKPVAGPNPINLPSTSWSTPMHSARMVSPYAYNPSPLISSRPW